MPGTIALQEFVRANDRLTDWDFNNLQTLGVDSSTLFGTLSLVGIGYVETVGQKLYRPSEQGYARYICPIGEGGPVGRWHSIYDLVAFSVDRPDDAYQTRFGEARILGPDWPDWCDLHEEPLRLFSNPLAWLRGGGRGSCILDWSINVPLALGNELTIDCDTPALASRIDRAYRSPSPLPTIRVISSEDTDDE